MKCRGDFCFGVRFYLHSLHFNTLHCYCNMLHLHLGSQGTIICVFTLLLDKLSTTIFSQKLSNLNCFYISLHLKQPYFFALWLLFSSNRKWQKRNRDSRTSERAAVEGKHETKVFYHCWLPVNYVDCILI